MHITEWAEKSRLLLKVDNFATVWDRKAYDLSKVFTFLSGKRYKTWMSVIFWFAFNAFEIMLNFTTTHNFTHEIFTQTNSESR